MKIHEIDIKNFRGYGENPDEEDGFFKFKDLDKPDIVLITGHNGYGKTSLYEAIEWCVTDNIKALRKYTEDVNYKATLKKSHYLKFQSIYDEEESKSKREVQVQIVFNNGRRLMRKTKYDSLHQDGYFSVVTNETGKIMSKEKNEVEEFIKEITGQPIENFFRLSFCGQAYTEDLIHNTSAKERGGIWLSFFGMNDVNEIVDKSDARGNTSLGRKLAEVQKEIDNEKKFKEKIDILFQTNDWGSIQAYRKLVSDKIELVNNFQKELQEIDIGQGDSFKKDTITDIVQTLKRSKLLKERMEQAYKEDNHQKRICVKKRLIREYTKNQRFLLKSDRIAKLDIVKLQHDIEKYSKDEEYYQDTLEELEKEELDIKNNLITLQKDIGEVFFLTETLIKKYEKEKELYKKLCSKSQKYGLKHEKQKVFLNVKRLLRYSDKYQNQIIADRARLDEKKQALRMMEGVNSNQKEMLLKVQTFVNQSKKIERCPVCGGIDFYTEGEEAKDKLLSIIENEISNGDENIKKYNADIVALETWIGRWEKSYYKKVWEKFTLGMKNLESTVNECIEKILGYLHGMRVCNSKMLERVQEKHSNMQKKAEEYKEFASEYSIEEDFLEGKMNQVKEINLKIENILAEEFQVFDIRTQEMEQLEEKGQIKIRLHIRRIYLEKKVIKVLEDMLQYDIGQENLALLEKYEEISSNFSKLIDKDELYQEAINFRKNVNQIAKNIQNEMMEKYIKNNAMIKVIYQFINPHPFFREIRIDKGNTETNIKLTQRDDIFLDHVFSEAQMKVLALSIFLGLNLSVKNSYFEQIYIDDPVQSMDDINMISFIDLLRALKTAKNVNKNFVIGTHDDNFSKLLKIKFRHRSFIEYHFESYSKEGPVVRMIKNKV